mmetsp:Transcript_1902/g.2908  ORF Transcript_1902/g.2908 Transcript_1902/m.2908 type:complete len:424 (-) Transcript_1902:39-1310(-)
MVDANLLELFRSIQSDLDTCKSKNAAELDNIQKKLDLLLVQCQETSKRQEQSKQRVKSPRRLRLKQDDDPCTPKSLQKKSVHFYTERKPKPNEKIDLHEYLKELSRKSAVEEIDQGVEVGRVSFTAQELFPESDKGRASYGTESLHSTPKQSKDDYPNLHQTPKAQTNQSSLRHTYTHQKSVSAAPRTPFASQTPYGCTPYSTSKQRLSASPTMAIESILPMDRLNEIDSIRIEYVNGRPKTIRSKADGMCSAFNDESELISGTSCQVLVEFKRHRVYQYDSPRIIAPGEYAIVSGDRGDDLGLVIYSWYSTKSGICAAGIAGAATGKNIGLGVGKVVRAATEVEVNIMHNALKDLELQALEACRARVQELRLPLAVVDAEYQYDRKKLTFFYQCEHRQDFRELIRDLYRTFKARIWMENVDD